MGSKKVINIDNSFKKVESEIQKVRGKNQLQAHRTGSRILSKLINYEWIKSAYFSEHDVNANTMSYVNLFSVIILC